MINIIAVVIKMQNLLPAYHNYLQLLMPYNIIYLSVKYSEVIFFFFLGG